LHFHSPFTLTRCNVFASALRCCCNCCHSFLLCRFRCCCFLRLLRYSDKEKCALTAVPSVSGLRVETAGNKAAGHSAPRTPCRLQQDTTNHRHLLATGLLPTTSPCTVHRVPVRRRHPRPSGVTAGMGTTPTACSTCPHYLFPDHYRNHRSHNQLIQLIKATTMMPVI